MKVHVLVEGASEKAFLDRWMPRAFKGHHFVTHPHQGKGTLPADPDARPDPRRRGLLDLLPATLRAYAATNEDTRILVLVDADNDNCVDLKNRLQNMIDRINPLRVVIRIAVEETEAFYLGDLGALKRAFPDADMQRAREYVPDSIIGTAELFGEIVGDGGLRKVMWAEQMGSAMTTHPARSRSPSFKAFHAGVKRLVAELKTKRKQKKHWKARHPGLRKTR